MSWRNFRLGCLEMTTSFWGGLKSSEFFNVQKNRWVWGQVVATEDTADKVAAGIGHAIANGVSLTSRLVGVAALGLGAVATGAVALGEFAVKRRPGRCFWAFAKVLSAARNECDLSQQTWLYKGIAGGARLAGRRSVDASKMYKRR